jgi:aspartate aminotransferase-like enzyme
MMVSALFEESGEIAPVDIGRFGKRAGEIIARATYPPRRRPH